MEYDGTYIDIPFKKSVLIIMGNICRFDTCFGRPKMLVFTRFLECQGNAEGTKHCKQRCFGWEI